MNEIYDGMRQFEAMVQRVGDVIRNQKKSEYRKILRWNYEIYRSTTFIRYWH
jgi:hypothetical protein